MKYLEAILGFLTTIARLFFRGKGKHKLVHSLADDSGNTGSSAEKYRSSTDCHRSDSLDLRETYPSSPQIMGGVLIVFAMGGYLLRILGS
ncbi:hypothetical protein [uncultured Parabacteroides sp.]|jgi:hypothetical protein|uniref:hypothetical protein n=1 Tax=uncultured Parabacteroides sp. TaxID=512312 RepID=UPI0025F886CE|nr:hypothetical protein [uncultured Parabacteroides sp.]